MADHATFVDNLITAANRIISSWLNDINNYVYRGSRPVYATTTGAANVYLLTLPGISLFTSAGLTVGDTFLWKAHQTNTGAATFSVAGNTTSPATAIQVNGSALVGSEIVIGGVYECTWTGAAWQLRGMLIIPSTVPFGGTGRATLTSGSILVGNGTGTVNFLTAAAQGDSIYASGAGAWSVVTVGAAGTIPMVRTASAAKIAYVAALSKYIYGWAYANNGGDSIDIPAGGGMDATGAYFIVGAALTKSIAANWVVGNAQGMLDTGAVGNNDYYIWAIARSDTGVVDYLASLSSTAPNMPANYDFKRLIGWFKRVGGTNVAFHTYETEGGGIEQTWDVPTLDINLANTLTTARRTDAVKVPLNFSTIAILNIVYNDAAASAVVNVCCPDQTDAAASGTAAPLANGWTTNAVASGEQLKVRTSAAGLIAARSNLATVDLYAASTVGFTWSRRP